MLGKKKKNEEEKKNDIVSSSDNSKSGFWNLCSGVVRQELIDSKARMHIAENKRRAAEDESKLARMNSPEALVQEIVRITRMADQMVKQTEDKAIGSWAKTVAESLAKSVAESAPSTVPSLASVGYGKSASKSDGDDSNSFDPSLELRLAEYKFAMGQVDKHYESLPAYSDDDYKFSVRAVKEKYADVAYGAKQLQNQATIEQVSLAMVNCGIGFQKIQDVLEGAGLKVEENY